MKNAQLSLAAILALGAGFPGMPGAIRSPRFKAKDPKPKTDHDFQRMSDAEKRRARKNQKRLRDMGRS